MAIYHLYGRRPPFPKIKNSLTDRAENSRLTNEIKAAKKRGDKFIIGYKKCLVYSMKEDDARWCGDFPTKDLAIVKLEIPLTADMRCPLNYKCRASRAKVVSIVNALTGKKLKAARSKNTHSFVYRPGETIKPVKHKWIKHAFDPANEECSSGIHFFLTEKEARDYDFT